MRKEEVVKQFTTPLDAGAFPLGTYHFYKREYLNIIYRTDLVRLRKMVPEPMEVTSPLCRSVWRRNYIFSTT
ncbi:acetoacetate decarboxylase family protein [Neobacillus drentensis]|uniref:acetoacetate decarboxylase family protein n=1 Tax=Neobacillus drentensis TaxID=220684 RepID=UPI003000031F